MALAFTVRDRMLDRYIKTVEAIARADIPVKAVAYLSAEFLTAAPHRQQPDQSRVSGNATEKAVAQVGQNLGELLDAGRRAGLGQRRPRPLAACYMDSLATLEIPAIGYGIRYEFGIFDQAIRDGWQVELTDKWLRFGNPWEIVRPEIGFEVKFGGRTEQLLDDEGRLSRALDARKQVVKGVAYDTPDARLSASTRATRCDCGRRRPSSLSISRAFNRRRLLRRGRMRKIAFGELRPRFSIPNDEPEAGKRAAPRAAVLFRLLLAAGHVPHSSRFRKIPIERFHENVRCAVERHASGDRGC